MGCFVADRSLMMWDVVLEKRFCKDAGFCVGDRTLEKCVVFCWKRGFYRFWKLCFRQVSVKRQDKMVVILYICVYIYFSF